MNICIEAQLLNHPRRSGLMTYTEGLVNGMSRIDDENDYTLAYYSLKQKAEAMPGPKKANFKKAVLSVPDGQFLGKQYIIDNIALPRFFKRNGIKIFHRTSGYTMPLTKGVFKILTVHDLRTITIGDQYSAQNINQYKKALNAVDICVVVSECTKHDLIQYMNMDEKKVKVTYLGADARYKPAEQSKVDEIKSRFGINMPYFLSVGSVPRKNIDGIIRGFAGCSFKNDYHLVLACKYDVEKYQKLIDSLEIKERVIFINDLTDDDLVALYTGCYCFVFPSLYEGFGLPILEAMQCGAPVITSNFSSCPEVAGDAALLVDPNKVDEITEAMNTICCDATLRDSLIEKGYQRSKLFSWNKFSEEMKKVYAMA